MNKYVLAGLAFLSIPSFPAFAQEKRPNILILIADDLSARHLGCYGDKVVKTPNIDKIAKGGLRFTRAYTAAPTCTPSRAGILTGQAIHRLKEGGNLHGVLPAEFVCFPELLARAGYTIGLVGKGWGPGSLEGTGRKMNPAGPPAKSFKEFLKGVKPDEPFYFWFGSTRPHRAYKLGSGVEAGIKLADVSVPPIWPDSKEVRSDIADYYANVQILDDQFGEVLQALEESGRAGDTIILVLSDNGMPFPRCKANLYDLGTNIPLIARWPGKTKEGGTNDAFISYTDLAPTILEAAKLQPRADMTGKSFLNLLLGTDAGKDRTHVFIERERHANVRKDNVGYPTRALRTDKFLYIKNFRPDRWPAGDPMMQFSVGPFGDVDDGPTKRQLMSWLNGSNDNHAALAALAALSLGKRPAEELYDCDADPHQMKNLAGDAKYADVKTKLAAQMLQWQKDTADPRAEANGGDDRFDTYKYFGQPGPGGKKAKEKAKAIMK